MTNPANIPDLPAGYRPMDSATQRLEVPEREGYHRHWFRGTAERIHRAQKAGYTFVDPKEVNVNNFDLGGDAKTSGNTDLGTRVSVVSGDELDNVGQPSRLYLMECKKELYEYGQKELQQKNLDVADALTGGRLSGKVAEGAIRGDGQYSKGAIPDLFIPNKPSRRT